MHAQLIEVLNIHIFVDLFASAAGSIFFCWATLTGVPTSRVRHTWVSTGAGRATLRLF